MMTMMTTMMRDEERERERERVEIDEITYTSLPFLPLLYQLLLLYKEAIFDF